MPLIERAARALAKAEHGTDDWNGLTAKDREQFKATAREVVKALRVPTPGMCLAGEHLLKKDRGLTVNVADVHDAWQNMVDEAVRLYPVSDG
ncbi:hypothetical protein ACLIMP_12690 [Novosphingobium aerophilum]|uniref:hypothetical protein n=1 Tax=Novosphingobium TaxID=165696 RepID=UPI002D79BF5C|nr:hypothetical protein [Novosphingobium sp. RL4]WRT92122.1 hypothetical protein U9J33_13010 [Novosphingobium sp. RL4]